MLLKDYLKNQIEKAVEVQLYRRRDNGSHGFHGDFLSDLESEGINSIDEIKNDLDITEFDWDLMDEDEYNQTIEANSCVTADFDEWYGDKNAKVLVVVLNHNVEIEK